MKDKILQSGLKKYSHFVTPFQFGTTSYCTNFLTSLSIDKDRAFEVAYTNPTPHKTDIDLDVSYFSKYGAKLCNVKSEQEITALSGGKWKLDWPSDMAGSELPSYVLFQYHVDNDVFNSLSAEAKKQEAAKAAEQQEQTGGK